MKYYVKFIGVLSQDIIQEIWKTYHPFKHSTNEYWQHDVITHIFSFHNESNAQLLYNALKYISNDDIELIKLEEPTEMVCLYSKKDMLTFSKILKNRLNISEIDGINISLYLDDKRMKTCKFLTIVWILLCIVTILFFPEQIITKYSTWILAVVFWIRYLYLKGDI